MTIDFKVKWNAATPIGTPTVIEGKCAVCTKNINNYQNHYMDENETVKICLTCVSKLSGSYESIFNNSETKYEK